MNELETGIQDAKTEEQKPGLNEVNQTFAHTLVFKLLSGEEIPIRQEDAETSPVTQTKVITEEIPVTSSADPNDGWGNHGLNDPGIYRYQGTPNVDEGKYSQKFLQDHQSSFIYVSKKDASFKED